MTRDPLTLRDEFRALLLRSLRRSLSRTRDFALALSGGIDSTLVAVALKEAGFEPTHVLTLAYGEYENEDVRIARRTARALGWSRIHEIVRVRRSGEALDAHARACILYSGCARKTVIEVSLLMWELVRETRARACDALVVGCEAGAMFGCDRMSLMARKVSPVEWRTCRLAALHIQECGWPLSANQVNRHFAEDHRLAWIDPFIDEDVIRFHLPLDYGELNPERDKGLAHRAFPLLLRLRPQRYSMQSRAGVPDAAHVFAREAGFATSTLYYHALAAELGVAHDGDARRLEHFRRRERARFASFIHREIRDANARSLTDYNPDCLDGEEVQKGGDLR